MRKIKLDREAMQALEQRRQAFVNKFGREPGPGDPIFFDPDADQPRFRTEAQMNEMRDEICTVMLNSGIDPAYVYAYFEDGPLANDGEQTVPDASRVG
jgi:hypothetical protein